MLRRCTVGVVATLAVALGALWPYGSSAASDAQLRLVKSRPVMVHGTGFARGERVRLVLRGPTGVFVTHTRAHADGALSARFAGSMLVRCAGFSITATGSAGSRARLLRRPPVSCTRASAWRSLNAA